MFRKGSKAVSVAQKATNSGVRRIPELPWI
jgi:hypothetical protein